MPNNICNICGGPYVYKDGKWKCPYCGAYKVEELSNEEVTLIYNAAQKLRLASFDESEELYMDIIKRYPQNSEAYWGLVLSKYAIKYEDDYDGRKLPTCFGTTIESILEDKDYLKAVSLCKDQDQKNYYIEQANHIEKIRKEWLDKASKEPKYDVFLCFKDSDKENNIDRTDDSIEVANLYTHLSSLGYKVFFSRESLRDKVAEKYEPYIYNALNTATVMVVYGSKKEYFTSVWMQNEWTRFSRRIREGKKLDGSLVIAVDGVDPSDLPKTLSLMQVLDARKKTFYGDLEKHIAKMVSITKKPSNVVEKIEIQSVTGKKKTSIANMVNTRELGTYQVPELTVDIETKIKTASGCIANEMYRNAKSIVNELLETNKDNGQILLLSLFIDLKARNLDEALYKLNNYTNTDLVKRVIENNDKEIGEVILGKISILVLNQVGSSYFDTWFEVVSRYNFNNRDNWIDRVLNAVTKLKSVKAREKYFGIVVDSIDGNDIDKHIFARNNFAMSLQNEGEFLLAEKYYNQVLKIEEGNYPALFGIMLCNISARNVADLDVLINYFNGFVDLGVILRYATDDERVDCFTKLLGSVVNCANNKDTVYVALDKVFEELLKYIPEINNDLLIKYSLEFADACKSKGKFAIAGKYYALVLGYNNQIDQAYWGLLQVNLKCKSNDELIRQKKIITEQKEFNSTIATVGYSEKELAKYLQVAKDQSKYLERKKQRRIRATITSIVAVLVAIIIAVSSAFVGHNLYRKKQYTITYELNGGLNSEENLANYSINDGDIVFNNPTKITNVEIISQEEKDNGYYDTVKDVTEYTFLGWYSEETFENKIEKITKGKTGNISLYAKWSNTETTTRKTCETAYKVDGNYIYFGRYPQTDVTITMGITLSSYVNELPTDKKLNGWTSYKYYSDGSNTTDYMWYKDISHTDGNKYRAVYFTEYRPYSCDISSSTNNSSQDNNGYYKNKVYWFRFDVIEWKVLESNYIKAKLLAEYILDSNQYDYNSKEDYSNNYAESTIRAWLNDSFYNTAFNDLQKGIINIVTVDNSARSTNPDNNATEFYNGKNTYACDNTQDKVWLLSEQEVTKSAYGFNTSDGARDSVRQKKNSAYAKCMGAHTSSGNGCWWLRSPEYFYADLAYCISTDGYTVSYSSVRNANYGVVPAIEIKL